MAKKFYHDITPLALCLWHNINGIESVWLNFSYEEQNTNYKREGVIKMLKKSLIGCVLLVVVVFGLLIFVGQPKIEQSMNKVLTHDPFVIAPEVQALHDTLTIMDWHSDSTLWARDLTKESDYGHVDIPRLMQGNVAIQMFTAVTKSPKGQNYEKNTGDFDNITLLAVTQLWPISTWNSLTQRALYQAEKLHDCAARVPDQFRVVTNQRELTKALVLRREEKKQGQVGLVIGMLGIEGLHALDGKLENIQVLYDAGYRMMGLHHFFDNKTGGSLHGISREGLTDFGRQAVKKLNELSVVIDLSHSSPAVVDDILELTTRPCVVSHTGVTRAYKSPRNLSDEQMVKIAQNGGLIAMGYWDGAVGDISPENIVRSIGLAVDLVGEDHVSLGSDFDGSTTTAFDTSEIAVLTQEMVKAGFSKERIAKIMGENGIKFLMANLPE